ncbi:hypothetical protein [Streptomyces griseocarneus]|uniref:hypothetical protein n=1 Tax=Streptomyces griseocarneus TaxID=51201 RepID=UPI00167D0B19|nr:hypothetical protein [Streptomyces griseocarneus]MBZ6476667.1 hypothetical protein [Streptomyces griseocarneus]GHG80212.1 hypothetical protein GCM10018779_61600 [Streptomyces griseocarneus]
MSVYDHKPMWAGAHYDPAPSGGEVTRLDLYATPERDGPVVASAAPAVRLRAGVYRFDLPTVPPGRYWGAVTFTPNSAGQPVTDTSVRLDLPTGQGLVGSPEAVADTLGVPLPLTSAQRAAYEGEIRNAHADVAAYLNRPLVPTATTLRGVTPRWAGALDDIDAWLVHVDDIAEVVSYRTNSDGTYDVDLLVGLNGAQEETVVRYVVAHAAESVRQRPDQSAGPGRRVSSVSAEGQSISYDAAPTTGQAGALPTIDSLNRLRRLVFQPLSRPSRAPWPYSSSRTRRWR